jgi:small subunit ribosomal protein S11
MKTIIQRLYTSKNRNKPRVRNGILHIRTTYNNTVVTFSSIAGDVLIWSSSGICGFRRARKSTPFASKLTTTTVVKKCIEQGVRDLRIYIWGPGPGREIAIRSVFEIGLRVTLLRDITSLPHNGCRSPKRRRVTIYLNELI